MPKLLWISTSSLHDNLSSDAVNSKLLLDGLVKIGWTIYVCSALTGSEGSELKLIDMRQKYGKYGQKAITFYENEINYVYTCCKSTDENKMTLSDMQVFYELCTGMLDLFSPDFVMGYGFNPGVLNCFAEAKRRGCWTIFMLLNDQYCNYKFPHIDLLLTSSYENALLYYTRSRINAIPIGEIFTPENIITSQHNPKYITLIDPSLEGGLSIFAKIALVFQQLDPSQRFLVVDRHGNYEQIMRQLRIEEDNTLDNLDCASYFASSPPKHAYEEDEYDEIKPHVYVNTERDPRTDYSRSEINVSKFNQKLALFDFTNVSTLSYQEEKQSKLLSVTPHEFSNVTVTGSHTNLLKVYEQTKILLIPSLAWESWGRFATEGVLNNIPIVASCSGGLQEATYGAGIHIMPPSRLQHRIDLLPNNAEIKPWIDAINQALTEDFSDKFKQALQKQVLEDCLERFQEAISCMLHQQLHTRVLFNHTDQWLGYPHPKYGYFRNNDTKPTCTS